MDVLIFCGQSNMQGQTEGLPSVNPIVSNALEYRFLTDSLVELRHPVGEDITVESELMLAAAYNGCGTLVPSFCEEYVKACGKRVIAIHAAKGATRVSQWLPDTERYKCLSEKITAGIRLASKLEPVEKIFFVWLQGESDAIEGISFEDYSARLLQLKNALKRDIGIDAFGIIEVGYFASEISWSDKPLDVRLQGDEAIMRAQESIVRQDGDFVLLTDICKQLSRCKEYINSDAEGHYNNKAMELVGRAAASGLAKIRMS